MDDLLFKVGANVDGWKEAMGDLSGTLGSTVEKVFETVAHLNPAVAGVVAAIGGISFAAFEAAEDFERATNIMIAATGATGEELGNLEEGFSAIFVNVPQAATEVADAVAQMNLRLDLTGASLQDAAKNALDLADALGEKSKPLIEAVTTAMLAWDIENGKAVTVMDKLLVIHQKTGIAVTSLASILADSQPILNQFGLSWEQAATMIGQFQKAGVPASDVVSSLGKAIKVMNDQGITPSLDEFEKLINSIKNAGTESQGTELAITAFGKSGAKMAGIIRDGKVDIDSFAEALKKAGGSVKDLDDRTDTLGERFTTLQHSAEKALVPLGKMFISFAEGFTGQGVEKLDQMIEKMEAQKREAAGIVDVIDKKVTPSFANYANQLDFVITGLDKTTASTLHLKPATDELGASSLQTTAQIKAHAEAQKQLDAVQKVLVSGTKEIHSEIEKFIPVWEQLGVSEAQITIATYEMNEAMNRVPVTASAAMLELQKLTASMQPKFPDEFGDAMARMGITISTTLAHSADQAVQDFITIRDSGVATPREIEDAWLKTYKEMAEVAAAHYQAIPAADQLMRARLLQQQKDYEEISLHGWETLWNSVHDTVRSGEDAIIHDVITGRGNIVADFEKMGTDILEAVVNKFLNPVKAAIADFVANTLTSLLSGQGFGGILDSLSNIGNAITGIFGGGGGVQSPGQIGGVPIGSVIGGTLSNTPWSEVFTPAAGAVGGVVPVIDKTVEGAVKAGSEATTGAVSGVASSTSSLISSVTGIVGAIGSVAGAVGSIYSNFQLDNIKQTLNYMHNDVAYGAWRGSVGGEHDAVLNTSNLLSVIFPTLMEARDDIKLLRMSTEFMSEVSQREIPQQTQIQMQMLTAMLARPALTINIETMYGDAEYAQYLASLIQQDMALQG